MGPGGRRQNVVTPEDAAIPETPVRGPFTMWAQADIITHHQLENTDGLFYAEMDRTVPEVDENGEAVLDENGEAVMVPNKARASWMNATTLTTALSLGIVSYALAAFAFVTGLTLVAVGIRVPSDPQEGRAALSAGPRTSKRQAPNQGPVLCHAC